jgi:hypothetical protein
VIYVPYADRDSFDLIESKLLDDIGKYGETWFNTNLWGPTLDKCVHMVLDDVVVNRYVPAAVARSLFLFPPQ